MFSYFLFYANTFLRDLRKELIGRIETEESME